jgi:hypothetical protein
MGVMAGLASPDPRAGQEGQFLFLGVDQNYDPLILQYNPVSDSWTALASGGVAALPSWGANYYDEETDCAYFIGYNDVSVFDFALEVWTYYSNVFTASGFDIFDGSALYLGHGQALVLNSDAELWVVSPRAIFNITKE